MMKLQSRYGAIHVSIVGFSNFTCKPNPNEPEPRIPRELGSLFFAPPLRTTPRLFHTTVPVYRERLIIDPLLDLTRDSHCLRGNDPVVP
jgi:hypothetical protein